MKIYYIDANNDTAQLNYPLVEALNCKSNFDVKYITSKNRYHQNYYYDNYNVISNFFFFKFSSRIKTVRVRRFFKVIEYIIDSVRLFWYIKNNKPDIIHFNNYFLSFIDYFSLKYYKKLGIKIVITKHNFLNHDTKNISKFGLLFLRKVDNIICLSSFVLKQFPIDLQSKITLIEHGNCYQKEVSIYKKNKSINIKYFDSNKVNILFFGLIRRYKGVELLLDSIEMLPEDYKCKIEVLILGRVLDSIYLKELKQKIKDSNLDNIVYIQDKFLSYQEALHAIDKTDVGVLPYLNASQSGVPFLYLSMYKPLVVTNVGALSEQVNMDIAEICKPEKSDMSKKIERIIDRVRNNEILDGSFIQFSEDNRWDTTIAKYVKFYKNIV